MRGGFVRLQVSGVQAGVRARALGSPCILGF